ncbi:AbrB family transcriptional regulator [Gallaecimonas kandeliae]|uniref:AbrB family transcriptional regulator n=1 Tax=Gallaecimonas kandeliae TaxID=3029055 RepID=UPI002649DB09|nr:AbrB family transcriptional regulator [Gallaecimonas kandeliae]WKE64386.1 AbrB family transcriptional regulator [Gallaecimonas kandeliae]
MSRLNAWAALLLLSLLFTLPLEALKLPAALLLGPMLAAMVLGVRDAPLALPKAGYSLAQVLIGLMVAASISLGLLHSLKSQLPLYLLVVLAILVLSGLIGWWLCKGPWLPGTTALWGIFPGAASAMVMMAQSGGADMGLVALMQYLRVLLVALSASLVAHVVGTAPHELQVPPWDGLGFALTALLALALMLAGRRFKLAAAPFLLAMGLGAALHLGLGFELVLPPWLLGAAYVVLGWQVGLGFTRETLALARKALLPMLLAIGLLMGLCALIGLVLVWLLGVSPLTAYLATSPGGMDAIAIIAAGSGVNLPFVMAIQTLRFVLILLFGPSLAAFLARRFERRQARLGPP